MITTKTEVKQDYRYSLRTQQILGVVFICSVTIFILMSVCLMSSYWITAEGFRQGLLYLCIEEPDSLGKSHNDALPFDLNKDELEPGCYPNRDKVYLKVCTFFCLITQLSALATACLAAISVRNRKSKRARSLKFAICTTFVTLLCDMALLIVYPIQFAKELDRSNRDLWELNGAFGLACGAAILALCVLIFLVAALKRTITSYDASPTRI